MTSIHSDDDVQADFSCLICGMLISLRGTANENTTVEHYRWQENYYEPKGFQLQRVFDDFDTTHEDYLLLGYFIPDYHGHENTYEEDWDHPVYRKLKMITNLRLDKAQKSSWARQREDGTSWVIKYDDCETENLTNIGSTWKKNPIGNYFIGRRSLTSFVHTKCWEMLQAISKQSTRGCITPRAFIKAVRYCLRHQETVETCETIPSREYTTLPHLYINEEIRSEYQVMFAIDHGAPVDVNTKSSQDHVQRIFRRANKVWIFIPIDRFPVAAAYLMKDINPYTKCIDCKSISAANLSRGILKLPAELLENIVLRLDLKSCIRMTATCKHLRKAVAPHLDQLAYQNLRKEYNWTLPITSREKSTWASIDAAQYKGNGPFPWLIYMRLCLREDHWAMINRKRVYDTASAFYELLNDQGYLES